VIREYVDHYNRARPHRGLGLEILTLLHQARWTERSSAASASVV
jgi:transposase InsO family protein